MTFVLNGDIQLCFIHVPRTAGRWAVEACKNSGLNVSRCGAQHETLERALRHNMGDRTIFSIKRHPLTWLRSWYASTKMNGWKGWNNVTNCLMAHEADTFEDFLLSYVETTPGMATQLWKQYLDRRVDFVLQHENIAEDLINMFQQLGLDKRKQIQGTPVLSKYQTKKEPCSEELIERLYTCDYELYQWLGYSKEFLL